MSKGILMIAACFLTLSCGVGWLRHLYCYGFECGGFTEGFSYMLATLLCAASIAGGFWVSVDHDRWWR